MRVLLVVACASASLPSCDGSLPPLGEVRVFVDTDLEVPFLGDRLRVDVYDASGARWYQSNEVRMDARSWPASFGLHLPEGSPGGQVMLRLRLYVAGTTRDYTGERFAARPTSADPSFEPPLPRRDDREPRLVIGGEDVTPRSEPEPNAAVDRLVRFALERDRSRTLRVVLRGACAGTMADLTRGLTCVDREDARVPAEEIDGSPSAPRGSFGAQPGCSISPREGTTLPSGEPAFDEELCVRGGAMLFGGRLHAAVTGPDAARPERIVIEPSFLLDRYEVTVGRYARAIAEGYEPTELPIVNEEDLSGDASSATSCTFTLARADRDAYPVNCVIKAEAQRFCRWLGGDLPSETQFELAAGRGTQRARYVWGEDDPTCELGIWGRETATKNGAGLCAARGVGVQREDDPSADVAVTGAMNLAGGLAEIAFDDARGLREACWASKSMRAPRCLDSSAPLRYRGGSWGNNIDTVEIERRGSFKRDAPSAQLGFRCARRGS